jgi:hypothetical protein
MNFRKSRKRIALALTTSAITLAAFYFSEATAGQGQNTSTETAILQNGISGQSVQIELANLRSQVRRVVVLARSDEWSFRRPMNEAELPSISCTYELDKGAPVNFLLDLLSDARFQADPTSRPGFDVRMGIYLFTDNGLKASFIFARPFKFENGEILARGTYNGATLAISSQLYDDVQTYLAGIQPTKTTFYCSRIK